MKLCEQISVATIDFDILTHKHTFKMGEGLGNWLLERP